MPRSIVLAALSLLVLTACNQAPVDGGWSGTADCEQGEDLTVEAIFDQELETNDVEGFFFIEYNIVFDFLGQTQTWRFTQRGEIDEGEWDPQDGVVEGEIIADDTEDADPAPNWIFNLELTGDDFETLEGNFDRVGGNGDVNLECDLELDKAHDPSN